jgi:hypothetical protein
MAWNYEDSWEDYLMEDPEVDYEIIPFDSEIYMCDIIDYYVCKYPNKGIKLEKFSEDYDTAYLDICGIPYVAKLCEKVNSFQFIPTRQTTEEEDKRALEAIDNFVYQYNIDNDWTYFSTYKDVEYLADYRQTSEDSRHEYVLLLDTKTLTVTHAEVNFYVEI